jgi:hypothetical protein
LSIILAKTTAAGFAGSVFALGVAADIAVYTD